MSTLDLRASEPLWQQYRTLSQERRVLHDRIMAVLEEQSAIGERLREQAGPAPRSAAQPAARPEQPAQPAWNDDDKEVFHVVQ